MAIMEQISDVQPHQTKQEYQELASKTEWLKMGLSMQADQHCQTGTMSYQREIY